MATCWAQAAVAAPPAPSDFMPCTPGLSVTFAFYDAAGQDRGVRQVDRVRGLGKAPRTCVIDQETRYADGRVEKDAWVREHLEDRILNAGWLSSMTAFRPPLLVAPLTTGQRWVFNRTAFSIAEIGTTFDVPAGTFDGCLRVVESSMPPGAHSAWLVYAPGVGLIAAEHNGRSRRAIEVKLGTVQR